MNVEAGSMADWAQAFSALVALGLAVWVGYRQTKLQEVAVKQSLFEKRYRVYEAVQTYLIEVEHKPQAYYSRLDQMMRDVRDHEFLYPKDVGTFIQKIFHEVMLCRTFVSMDLESPGGKESLEWITKNAFDEAQRIFRPYLTLSE